VARPHHRTTERSPADVDAALARIRQTGGRVTTSKRAIVTTLYGSTTGVTADQLAVELPHVDLTTVYRTLGQLEEVGIVEHVHLGHGPAVYRLLGPATVTVLCDTCDRVTLVPASAFADIASSIEEQYGIVLNLHHFAVSGHCADHD
jgi:Fe2+ or Zn2+ uptake regulation protein